MALAVAALAGCAWGPGAGFATLQKAVTTQALPISADRLDETGRWKTDNGYRLTIAERLVRVHVAGVTIDGPAAAGAAATASAAFDPANPPPGYSLCHGGHCHRADGALVDYADIQASLAGGNAAPATQRLMALVPTSKVAFVPLGGEASLDSFNCRAGADGACEFGQGTAASSDLLVQAVQAYGQAAAGPGLAALGSGSVEWVLDLDMIAQPSAFRAGLAPRVIDRLGPAGLRFTGRFQVTERLLDGIQWDRLAQSAAGATIKLEADAATKEQILTNLAKSAWSAELAP
jgi:hypothetical protein